MGDASGLWVLAPTVVDWSPLERTTYWHADAVEVTFTFDVAMENWQTSAYSVLRCKDGLVCGSLNGYSDPQWLGSDRIRGWVKPLKCPGNFYPYIDALNAKSEVGGHKLDGGITYTLNRNGRGPNGDNLFNLLITNLLDPNCGNTATSFSHAGAFRDGNTVTDKPASYSVTLNTNRVVFQIVEYDSTNQTTRSRPFLLADRPNNYDAIMNVNSLPPLTTPPVFYEPSDLTGPAKDLPIQVSDILFVASNPDFFPPLLPAITKLGQRGFSCGTVQTTSNAENVRTTLADYYNAWVDQHWGRRPRVVFIGEANEDPASPLNNLGTFYSPDSTGICFYTTTCPRDPYLVDFNGDLLPDLPWTRVPVNNVAELNNAVQTYCDVLDGVHISSPKAVIFDGDIDMNCDIVAEPHDTNVLVQQMYQSHGIPTVMIRDSQFADCWDWVSRQNLAKNTINAGVTELVGSGQFSDRGISPAFLIQDGYPPYRNMGMVTTPQRLVGLFPACDFGDGDRRNPSSYPSIFKSFLVAPPTGTTAVFWASHGRGAWCPAHTFWEREFITVRHSNQCTDLAEVGWQAYNNVGTQQPGLLDYLGTVQFYGWPVALPGFPVAVNESPPVGTQLMLANTPNPFNVRTAIKFSLERNEEATLRVFDPQGRLVVTLLKGYTEAGWHTIAWDGTDQFGRSCASGCYYARLEAGQQSRQQKLLLLK